MEKGLRRAEGGKNVQFKEEDEPQSPDVNRLHMQESDAKGDLKFIEDALAGEGGADGMPIVSSLAELSKTKSRVMRDEEALADELEEEKELEE